MSFFQKKMSQNDWTTILPFLDQWLIFYWPKEKFSGQPKASPHFRHCNARYSLKKKLIKHMLYNKRYTCKCTTTTKEKKTSFLTSWGLLYRYWYVYNPQNKSQPLICAKDHCFKTQKKGSTRTNVITLTDDDRST